jgi:hypothetical protein
MIVTQNFQRTVKIVPITPIPFGRGTEPDQKWAVYDGVLKTILFNEGG